jgi:hypothetical protein
VYEIIRQIQLGLDQRLAAEFLFLSAPPDSKGWFVTVKWFVKASIRGVPPEIKAVQRWVRVVLPGDQRRRGGPEEKGVTECEWASQGCCRNEDRDSNGESHGIFAPSQYCQVEGYNLSS